jgi:hypothetical protein
MLSRGRSAVWLKRPPFGRDTGEHGRVEVAGGRDRDEHHRADPSDRAIVAMRQKSGLPAHDTVADAQSRSSPDDWLPDTAKYALTDR